MDGTELTGAVLADRFELKELIGEGGYGAIFRAIQLSVDRACAVKVLPPTLCGGRTEERFRIEARMTSRLTHPNTVVVYDFGRDETTDVLFLAMELLEGNSVKDAVEKRGPMTVEKTARIVAQAAASLQEAHEEGAAHRDVSPHNLMLVERGGTERFVKVIDFGIAKALRADMTLKKSLTQSGMMIGKPAYMAPEQIRSGEIDGRADQYGLAVTAYYTLVGRPPFGEGASMAIASRQLAETPVAPTAHRSELAMSEEAESVLMKALEKDPDDRFQTIDDFGEAFDAAVGSGKAAVESRASETVEPDAESGADTSQTSTRAVPRRAWPDESGGADGGGGRTEVRASTTVPVEADDREVSRRQLALIGVAAVLFVATGGLVAWRLSGTADGGERVHSQGASASDASHASSPTGSEGTPATDSTRDAGGDRDGSVDGRGATAATDGGPETDDDRQTPAAREQPSGRDDPRQPEGEMPTRRAERASDSTEAPGAKGQTEPTKERETSAQQEEPTADASSEGDKAASGGGRGAGAPATLDVRMIPWGTLVVDGRSFERGSRIETELAPGTYRLQMKQRGKVVVEREIRVGAGETQSVELIAP